MSKKTITKRCPFCSKESSIEVDMGKLAQYNAGENIMRAFGDKNPFERELIMTGMCFECQENVFSRPAPGNEEK